MKTLWTTQCNAFQVSKCVQLPKSWKQSLPFKQPSYSEKQKHSCPSPQIFMPNMLLWILVFWQHQTFQDFCLWTEISSPPNKNQAMFTKYIYFEENNAAKIFLAACIGWSQEGEKWPVFNLWLCPAEKCSFYGMGLSFVIISHCKETSALCDWHLQKPCSQWVFHARTSPLLSAS